MRLRTHQRAAVDAVKDRLAAGVRGQVAQLCTGAGKTPIAASLPDELGLASDDWMLMLAHTDELAQQAVDKLRKWNPSREVGIEMGSNYAEGGCTLVVGSPQTLGRKNSARIERLRKERGKAPKVIVTDEVHHAVSSTYKRVYDFFPETELLLGLTATTKRSDGKGLHSAGYEEIVFQYPMIQAIKDGWLCEPRGIRVDTKTALDSVHIKGGDFDPNELAKAVDNPVRNALAVQSFLERGEDRQTVVFAVDIQHAKNLADAFKKAGIAAEAIWGDDPARAEKLKAHREGKLRVLTNCQILTEGYDDWRLACIILARPTQSELLYTQIIGRGTRIPEGIENLKVAKQMGLWLPKEDCLVLDLVDNCQKHSLMTLASLHGLNHNVDLKGRKITEVVEEIEEMKAQCPTLDLKQHISLDGLKAYAESVDLFQPKETPQEVASLSKFRWTKVDDGYVLVLQKNESLCAVTDMLGRWHVVGRVNGNDVHRDMGWELADAIQEADYQVQLHGGRQLQSLVKRAAKWHDLEPTEGQLKMCKWYGIKIPRDENGNPLVNRGQVHNAINEAVAKAKEAQKGKKVA